MRLVTGEAFCQVGDKPVKLQYGEHNATLQNTVLVCTVRTGSETIYVLGGAVSDGENTFTAGKTGCYVGQELSVQDMDLQALSSFALDCVLGCGESIFCSADEVQAVLDGRNVPAEVIRPENPAMEVNSGLCLGSMPSLRKMRPTSYTRSIPPTIRRLRYSSVSMRSTMSMFRLL